MMFYFVTATLRKKTAPAYTPYQSFSWTISADGLVEARQAALDQIKDAGDDYGMLFLERSDQVTSWVEHARHANDFATRTTGRTQPFPVKGKNILD